MEKRGPRRGARVYNACSGGGGGGDGKRNPVTGHAMPIDFTSLRVYVYT